jgi:feruloyl esterase
MSHCSGGSGADQFDPMTPIINWIEAGTQPTTILSRHFTGSTITFTRTLCPYPSISHYIHGSASQASSFGCIAGPTGVPGTGTGDGLQTP